jgi:hypothetical protein
MGPALFHRPHSRSGPLGCVRNEPSGEAGAGETSRGTAQPAGGGKRLLEEVTGASGTLPTLSLTS